jgi:hypothetical protein
MKRKKGEWFEFTVEGSGEFPFDMLRYDSCWPKSEGHDSGQLSHHAHGKRRVVLVTCYEGAPTPGRWESFNWCYVGPGELRDPAEYPTPLHRPQGKGTLARMG